MTIEFKEDEDIADYYIGYIKNAPTYIVYKGAVDKKWNAIYFVSRRRAIDHSFDNKEDIFKFLIDRFNS